MEITTAQWGNPEKTSIIVNGLVHIPWPCQTWHRTVVQAWLDDGHKPEPAIALDIEGDAKSKRGKSK